MDCYNGMLNNDIGKFRRNSIGCQYDVLNLPNFQGRTPVA